MRAIDIENPSGRALLLAALIFINLCLEKLRKQPYFDKDSAGMEDGEGRLRKGISEI